MNPIVSNHFPKLQPSSVQVKSQATLINHHKQDFTLLAPTSIYKENKKIFFTLDEPVTTNSTYPPHTTSRAHSFQQLVKDLRRTFPSLGPHKKVLNPPSYTQNTYSFDFYHKQKYNILYSSCVTILEFNWKHNKMRFQLALNKTSCCKPPPTTHPLSIRALQTTKYKIRPSVSPPSSF